MLFWKKDARLSSVQMRVQPAPAIFLSALPSIIGTKALLQDDDRYVVDFLSLTPLCILVRSTRYVNLL